MLEARSLTKYYDHTPAVRDVSFTVQRGEILGYLGCNGAGKSTTVKMLTGLLEPSAGQIFFDGESVHGNFTDFQRRIGYVPEEAHLYSHLTGREYLRLIGRLRGMPHDILEPKIDRLLLHFSLKGSGDDPISSYSKGMRQKVLLSAALLHNPDILILDEPFSGLDTTSALMLRSVLRKLAAQGKIILFSSHVLEVVEKVCTKVLILRNGEVVAYDSIERLRELMSQPSLEAVFAQLSETEDSEAVADRVLDVINSGAISPPKAPPVALGLRVYRSLAGAFPHEFGNVYGDELLAAGEQSIEPVWRRHGIGGIARLLLDIAIRLPVEHFAELRQDVRYGLRALISSPGFTSVALISLSLGICIATCAFSEMNGFTLRSLPGARDPARLVALQSPTSFPSYRRFSRQSDLWDSTMAYAAPVPFSISNGSQAERTWGHLVTTSYFDTLGTRPALGTFFRPEHEQPGQAPIVVVSHRLWRDRLGSDPSIIGRQLRINGRPATVIGVAPEEFAGASPFLFAADLWMPVSVGGAVAPELSNNALEQYNLSMFFMVGRVKPGATLARAEAELDAIARQLDRDHGITDRDEKHRRVLLVDGGKLLPLRKQDVPFFTSFLTIMASLIMLIACANVATMMLARAAGRRKEMAVRLALGASRIRLIRQLLTESMMLAAVAGAAGFVASAWLMSLSSQVRMPFPMPVAFDFRPDGQVLILTIALTLATGLVFGLAPALQATRTDLAPALKDGGNLFYRAHRRFSLRNILMVSQVAGSLTLLVLLGLLAFGIQTTLSMQAGFNPRNLYMITLDPARDGYSGDRLANFFDTLFNRVKALPSVTAASLTETVPVSMPGANVTVSSDQHVTVRAFKHVVGKEYFDTTGISLRLGRAFRKEDEAKQSAKVIVSDALARELWPGGASAGLRVEIGNGEVGVPKVLPGLFDYRPTVTGNGLETFEVVGVAADVAEGLIVGKPRPAIYFPLRPSGFAHPSPQGITLLLRAAPGTDVLTAVRRELAMIDQSITPINARSMDDQIAQFMAPLRMAAWTYGIIGAFGLVLAAVGLAGVTAYAVAQRGREIGIRMALGARRGDVMLLVMREGLALVTAGTLLGMLGGWGGSRMLAAMNSSVGTVSSTSTSDPTVLIGAPLVLACLALFACYVPARRTTRIDPAIALRQE